MTLPTILSIARLVLSPIPVLSAWWGAPGWTFVLIALLAATDLLDGVLARLWRIETPQGARLDSLADFAFGCAMAGSVLVINAEMIGAYAVGLTLLVLSYAASVAFSWYRFRRAPSYHTWAAKAGMVLMTFACLAIIAMEFGLPVTMASYVLAVAVLIVIAANVETIFITGLIEEPATNVKSVFSLLRRR